MYLGRKPLNTTVRIKCLGRKPLKIPVTIKSLAMPTRLVVERMTAKVKGQPLQTTNHQSTLTRITEPLELRIITSRRTNPSRTKMSLRKIRSNLPKILARLLLIPSSQTRFRSRVPAKRKTPQIGTCRRRSRSLRRNRQNAR